MGWFDRWRPRSALVGDRSAASVSDGKRTRPRSAHYNFAHYALREIAFARPLTFFAELASDDAPSFLAAVFKMVAEDCAEQGEPPDFTVQDLQVHTGRIVNRPLVVVQLPPPRAATEAYFIGAVMQADVEHSEVPQNPDIRYFTLEQTLGGGALLCEWTTNSHSQLGPCEATREDFVRGIMEAM